MDEPSVKEWDNMLWPFCGKTVKSDAKGAESGKELGPLMPQMDHERSRNRHCLQKHLTLGSVFWNIYRGGWKERAYIVVQL